jgi:hypothetical protein
MRMNCVIRGAWCVKYSPGARVFVYATRTTEHVLIYGR